MTNATKSWADGTALAVRGVLAGAYLRHNGAVVMVTHAVVVDADGWEQGDTTICKRVKVERLADEGGGPHLAAPTCPTCAKRAAR